MLHTLWPSSSSPSCWSSSLARAEGALRRHCPTEGCGIREGAIAVVLVVNGNNVDKGMGQQVRGRGGMERPLLLSDPLTRWTEDNRGDRGGGGRHDPPLGSHHRRGVGNSNPMLASLTWMSFTTTVPLTLRVVPGHLHINDAYLEDAAIPSRFTLSG